MDFDRGESPASTFVGDGQDDNPLPADLKYRPEVRLPPESWWVRAIRIAVVAVIACWIVAGIVVFIMR
jgi:hypothetical protein